VTRRASASAPIVLPLENAYLVSNAAVEEGRGEEADDKQPSATSPTASSGTDAAAGSQVAASANTPTSFVKVLWQSSAQGVAKGVFSTFGDFALIAGPTSIVSPVCIAIMVVHICVVWMIY
jgi:hypothetical protein